MEDYLVTTILSDTTKISSCRKGDILTWVKDTSSIWAQESKFDISDFWVMNNGESVLFSNRIEDIPEWFPLSHTMVGGRQNCRKMVEKLNNGYTPNGHGIDVDSLPNIWKINVWNYIIWSGEKRPDVVDHKGILGIFRFDTGSLVIRQSAGDELIEDSFGDSGEAMTSARANEIRGAFDFIQSQGKARKYSEKWTLG